MAVPVPNWDLRRIPVTCPYIRVLIRGCPVHAGDDFSLRHPRMERGLRAKIFAPFDALDGFSAMIRQKDRLCEEAVPEKTEGNICMSREDP